MTSFSAVLSQEDHMKHQSSVGVRKDSSYTHIHMHNQDPTGPPLTPHEELQQKGKDFRVAQAPPLLRLAQCWFILSVCPSFHDPGDE